jgi:hypothetical protein
MMVMLSSATGGTKLSKEFEGNASSMHPMIHGQQQRQKKTKETVHAISGAKVMDQDRGHDPAKCECKRPKEIRLTTKVKYFNLSSKF